MRNYILNSTPATHYTTAIAANGGTETEVFPGLRADGFGCIDAIRIKSEENLSWQVEVLNDDGEILWVKRFAYTDAIEVADGSFYYQAFDLEMPIPSLTKETVTVGIRNLSGEPKTAGTSGALTLTLVIKK